MVAIRAWVVAMAQALVNSVAFRVTVCALVVGNCAIIGMEADKSAQRDDLDGLGLLLYTIEPCFAAAFVLEYALRFLAFGRLLWQSHVNLLETAIVVANALSVALVYLLGDGVFFRVITLCRVLPLMHRLRLLRRVSMAEAIWNLLSGVHNSLLVLLGTILVIGSVTYMFSIFGVIFIGRQIWQELAEAPEGSAEHAELAFLASVLGTVPSAMYTLVQVLTLDSWMEIARPCEKYVQSSWIFFVAYIAVAVITLMDLVTAIIVDRALTISKADEATMLQHKARKYEADLKKLMKLFQLMDSDSSGELTWEEFDDAFEIGEICKKLRSLGLDRGKCYEMFSTFSSDGILSMEDFFSGLRKMRGDAEAEDLLQLIKVVELSTGLLIQMDEEVTQDLHAMYTQMGSRAPARRGSLRRRACARKPEPPSATCSVAGFSDIPCCIRGHPCGYTTASPVLLDRVRQLAQTVEASKAQVSELMEACECRVDACCGQLDCLAAEAAEVVQEVSRLLAAHGGGGSDDASGPHLVKFKGCKGAFCGCDTQHCTLLSRRCDATNGGSPRRHQQALGPVELRDGFCYTMPSCCTVGGAAQHVADVAGVFIPAMKPNIEM